MDPDSVKTTLSNLAFGNVMAAAARDYQKLFVVDMSEFESSVQSTSTPTTSSSRTMVTNTKFDVEKFDNTNNFSMWQCEVLDVLYQQELDVALEEDRPESVDEKDWTRINRLACGTIRLCLSKELKYPFMRETSASKLWKELEDKFMKKSKENKLYMRTKLYRFQYLPSTTMNDHITRFDSLVTNLLNLDEKVSDVDKALILLASLPDEYEHLIVSMLNGKETITFKEVTTALYSNEIRKKDKLEHTSSTGEAHTVRGRNQSRKPGRRGRSHSKGKIAKDECAFCHVKGHWKKDCPKLLKKKGKAISEACVAENDNSDFSLACVSLVTRTDEWLCDSACSFHMCFREEWFFNFKELDGGVVYLADNQPCKVVGIGSINLKNHDGLTRVLTDVRYIPKLEKNLISLGALESKGFTIIMQNGILKVVSGTLVVMKGIRKNNMYLYQGSTTVGTAATVLKADRVAEMSKLWHMRFGHAGEKSLETLAKQGVLKGAKTCKLDFCEQCVLGKQTRVKFSTVIQNTEGILDYIHIDVWGPTKTVSLGGKHYFVTFVDDFSRRVWVYTMRSKDEVFGKFLVWKKMMENQTRRKVKILRSDNGTEYRNDPFFDFFKKEGIFWHFTVRDTPQQNGMAKRMNRILLEEVRCMLSNVGLGKQFWAEAVTYAGHLINRLPSAALKGKTPLEELLTQQKAQASSSINQEVDLDELMDDPELERLHADRIAALKKEAEKRQALKKQGHGEYREITEGDFLGEVTGSDKVICHFYHREFYRCKIMDKHLKSLAPRHMDTKFIKLDAENAPFFVTKLGVKTLPCVILFRKGIAVDRLIGFQDMGGNDDFTTRALEVLLIKKGIVSEKKKDEDDEDSGYPESKRTTVRSSVDPNSDSD